jgi:hypothetical protein
MRIKTPVLVTIANSPHPSHERVALPPARPSGRARAGPGRKGRGSCSFRPQKPAQSPGGPGWSVGAQPLWSRSRHHTQGTAASPSKRREPASFRRRVPDSVAACLVSASFHRFAPLLPLIGGFRAYRRRAIAAINGLALSSIPPNPRSGHLLDGAGSPQLRPAHSFKPARN